MARRKKSGKSRQSAPVNQPRRQYSPDWPIVILAIAGMLVTAYLSISHLFGATPIGCAEGSSCDIIQQSRWSILLGIPVALWGFGLYLLIALIAGLGRPRLKRWQRLWLLSFFGMIFSAYLTAVAALELQAFCAWCLTSLAIIIVMFVMLTFKRPESAPGMPWAGFLAGQGALVAVLLVALHAFYAGWFQPPEDPRLRALAEHLDRTGAVYYGASWCPSCQEQNSMFGPSYERLPYVECNPQGRGGGLAFECAANEITSYPTWIIGNRRLEQALEPEELARYSRFDWAGWQPDEQ